MPGATKIREHPCGCIDLNVSPEVIRYCLRGYWGRQAWQDLPCGGELGRCNCPYPNEYQAKLGLKPRQRQLRLM